MQTGNDVSKRRWLRRLSGLPRPLLAAMAAAVAIIGFIGWAILSSGVGEGGPEDVAVVRRGALRITVTESGSVKSLREENVKSEVEGTARIINIVPEGTYISKGDIAAGRVLVELDSSSLRERLAQQEINLAAATANYEQAEEAHKIQINQNESDIRAGQLKVEFAGLDFLNYLGETAGARVTLENLNADALIDDPSLGGSALQQKRKLESAIDVAREELARAEVTLSFTEKLFAAGYVSQQERDADRLALKQRQIEVEQAQTALDLFRKFEFPKQTRKLLSDWNESTHELERIEAQARAQLARSESARQSARSSYETHKTQTEKLRQQVESCTIRATQPGLVVYATGSGRTPVRIEEGVEIRQQQSILYMPDLSDMACDVRIHESEIEKVRVGQRCSISVDALPDQRFTGEVLKVGAVAASQDFLNRNLKVYPVDVSIENASERLKPGMSARVEIVVAELEDTLYTPVQAVFPRADRQVCYVRGGGIEARPVTIGLSSLDSVAIESGLEEGEKVLLYQPTPPPPLPAGMEPAPAARNTAGKSERQRGTRGSAANGESKPSETRGATDNGQGHGKAEGDRSGKVNGGGSSSASEGPPPDGPPPDGPPPGGPPE